MIAPVDENNRVRLTRFGDGDANVVVKTVLRSLNRATARVSSRLARFSSFLRDDLWFFYWFGAFLMKDLRRSGN